MNAIRVGKVGINLANVAYWEQVGDGEVHVVFVTPSEGGHSFFPFRGEEAKAVLWFLSGQTRDLLELYRTGRPVTDFFPIEAGA